MKGETSDRFKVYSRVQQGDPMAQDLFGTPEDEIMEFTVCCGLVCATIREDVFTELDDL